MLDLFFISSPLHMLMAANLSLSEPERVHVAIMIAKQAAAQARHAAIAERFPELFNRVVMLPAPGRWRGTFRARGGIRILEDLIADADAIRIFTGNDRRMEFQYAMHIATRRGRQVEGIYLDEGAVTYTGHKSMHRIQHRYIDPCFKKVCHGFWYRNAITTGASAWIETACVAFPDAVHPLLRGKRLKPIALAPFKTDALKALAAAMLDGHADYSELLGGIKFLLTLPHEGSYRRHPDRYRAIDRALGAAIPPATVAIKPHPRITDPGMVARMFPGAVVLDHRVGMEAMLPLLNDTCIVAGDISSTLLTTRWLRPDLTVVAIAGREAAPAGLLKLYDRLRIPVVPPADLPAWLATLDTPPPLG